MQARSTADPWAWVRLDGDPFFINPGLLIGGSKGLIPHISPRDTPLSVNWGGKKLWVDGILHHFEAIGIHCCLAFTRESLFQGCSNGAKRISSVNITDPTRQNPLAIRSPAFRKTSVAMAHLAPGGTCWRSHSSSRRRSTARPWATNRGPGVSRSGRLGLGLPV